LLVDSFDGDGANDKTMVIDNREFFFTFLMLMTGITDA